MSGAAQQPAAETLPFNGSYNNTSAVFERFQELRSEQATYTVGWACIYGSPRPGVTLFAWIGVELRADGLLRLAGAYALEPYEGTGRELVWSRTFDVVPGGPGQRHAVAAIGSGLVSNLPLAVSAFADALQRRV